MRLNIGFYLLILLVSCLHKLRANQDVDGTIVWVDNDKKEKDITVDAPNTIDNGEIKYWKFADNRIDNVDEVGPKAHYKNNNGPAMFVGNEDTPSTAKDHHDEESVEPNDSVEAHYVAAGTDEENVDIDDNQNSEAETHNDGTHYDGAMTEHFSSPVNQIDVPVERTENSNLKSEVGDGSVVEADEDDEGKNIVSSDKEQIEAADTILDSLSDDHAEREFVTETADTKAIIQRHHNKTTGFHNRTKGSRKKSSDVSGKARSILYDGRNVKKDHGVGQTAVDNYGGELARNSLGAYAPDDSDITDIVSHFTDNKSEDRHRMGRDELQMHLDDEALKMEVKAIEEEDSNVKSVLQGAEKFANGQKLGHLEGDFEKDLIKDIGKDKVEVEGGSNGNKNGDVDIAEDGKDDDNERRGASRNEDEEEEGEEEKEKQQEHNDDDEIEEDKPDDENGERKHLISKHKDSKHSAPAKLKHRKYRLFGGSTGHALPDDPDWRVDYDNEAMESEVKAIEAADSKVSAALQGIKSHSSQDIDEYKYDNPQFYTADGRPIHRHHHRAAKKHLTDGREKKISNEKPNKRDLKKDDDYAAKKSTRHGRRNAHGSRKLKHETNKALPLKKVNKNIKSSNRNDSKQKYNRQELRILKLMYPSLAARSIKNKSHKQHKKYIEKRFITPAAKGRSKKQRNVRRQESDIQSSGKHGFRRLLAKKKPTVSKEVNEVGRRREEVQEGMTGAISYTNRDGNEFMFAVSIDTLTWSEASSKCQSIGGELVSIGDKEEQEFIQTNVIPEKGHYWIGFTDQDDEGVWQWKDKTPVRYTNWSNLEPDDGNIKNGEATHNEDCAVINPTMDWSDVPCWNRFQFICKLSPDNGRAISFGGTMSHSDVGNKQFDGFAEGLKNKPSIPTKKPVKENNAKTRGKTNEMMKGYSGQGPSRGGYKAKEEEPAKTEQTVKSNSAMVKGKEAGVPGGAEASTARTANALAQATANAGANNKPIKSPAPAAMRPGKYVNAGGGGGQPGVTGLGAVPGVTTAAFNANAGLGKIGGAGGGGAQSAVQQGGNGGQSAMNMNQQGGGANMGGGAQGGGGNGGNMGGARPMPAGANGGAPGHVATNGGLAQAPNNGAAAGGGNPGGGNIARPAAGGRVPVGNGGVAPARPGNVGGGRPAVMQAPAGGMQAPAGGMQAPAGGMQAPSGGMQAPAGGMQAPAGGMQAPAGGIQAPAGGVQAPSGGMQAPAGGMQAPVGGGGAAPQNKPAAQGGGGPSGGGAPELSPLQAKVAQQLANVMAPQLEREYASKFEPEMEMMKTICGKLCADVAIALPNEDAEKTGKACGGICARSLLRKSPEEAMDLLIGLAKGAGSRPTSPVMSVPTGAIPVVVPVNGGGTGGGTGNAQGNGGTGGNSNTGGGNGGGSNGGGSSGGGGDSDGGGGNTGGGGNAGGGSSSSNNGGGNSFQFGNGKPINLEALGADFASKLGLNVNSDGKLTASNGGSLKEKLTEAISSLKNENNVKTSTASKSILPGRRSKHKVVKVKGYYTLKKTGDAMVSPTKKHDVRKSKKKHFRKSKKSSNGSKKSSAESKKSTEESKKSTEESNESTAESKKSTEESKKSTEESKESTAESKESTAESKKSTAESKKSTEESKESTTESKESTTESKESTAESEKSTEESEKSTAESEKSTEESKKSTAESQKSLTGSKKSQTGSKKSHTGSKKSLKGSKPNETANIRKKMFILTL